VNNPEESHLLAELARELGAIEVILVRGAANAQLLYDRPDLATEPRFRQCLDIADAGSLLVVRFERSDGEPGVTAAFP